MQTADSIAKALRAQFDLEAEEGGEIVNWAGLWSHLEGTESLEIEGVDSPISLKAVTAGYDEGERLMVLKIGDLYFAHSGRYASHYGYEWEDDDDLYEVQIRERVVRYWDAVR